jgi:hypothetical protein
MLLSSIATRLAREGRKVVLTATRPFRPVPDSRAPVFLTDERPFGQLLPNLAEHGMITVAPEAQPDGRLRGFGPEEVDSFVDVGDYLFVESEDSHGESLPARGDSRVISPLTTLLVAVAGLDALGPDLDCAAFADRLTRPGGLLRVPDGPERRILMLNKADRNSIRRDGARVTKEVRVRLGEEAASLKILLTSVRDFLRRR